MSINLLKRLESSVYSFRLTLDRIRKLIDTTIEAINNYTNGQCVLDLIEVSETDDLDEALDELGDEYSEDEVRLVRIKFLSELAN
jgi:hypothetical protein